MAWLKSDAGPRELGLSVFWHGAKLQVLVRLPRRLLEELGAEPEPRIDLRWGVGDDYGQVMLRPANGHGGGLGTKPYGRDGAQARTTIKRLASLGYRPDTHGMVGCPTRIVDGAAVVTLPDGWLTQPRPGEPA